MKGVVSRIRKKRRRRAPHGISFSFAIFMLAALLLRHWLSFSATPAEVGAPSKSVASEQVRPAAGKSRIAALKNPSTDHSALMFDLSPTALPGSPSPAAETETEPPNEPFERLDEQTLQVDTPTDFEITKSGLPRLGPPIVPGAAILLEAWPGTCVPEGFIPSDSALHTRGAPRSR
jgi:hypothetical protein